MLRHSCREIEHGWLGICVGQSRKHIDVINNTREGIQSKIWKRANGGQIQIPDVLNNENCPVQHCVGVPYFHGIWDLNLPPISALPFTTNVSGSNAPSSVTYSLYASTVICVRAKCTSARQA